MHASRKFDEIVDASASKRHQKIWWIQKVRRENFCALFILLGTLLRYRHRFFIKLGIKPRMHLVEINILSLNNVTIRPTKIMNRANKNWAHF